MSDPRDPSWTWQYGFDADEMAERKLKNNSFVLPETGFRFIDDHFGLRPGCLHTLLGSTGRGKSTLVQSLILEWGKKTEILLYLSEESIDRVEVKLFEKEKDAGYLTTRLHVVHEEEILRKITSDAYSSLIDLLEAKAVSSKAKILIIDNLTTSQFYEGKFNNVMGLLSKLRSLAARLQIAVFLICHTKKGVNETTKGLIMPDDVRGAATLGLTSDYFYTFYRIRITNEFGSSKDAAFIYVSKSRDHDNQDSVYRLEYELGRKRYIRDTPINFKAFKDVLRERDRA